MPMDIRNFFGVAAKKKSTKAAGAGAGASGGSTSGVGAAGKKRQEPPAVAASSIKKTKNGDPTVDDSDTDVGEDGCDQTTSKASRSVENNKQKKAGGSSSSSGKKRKVAVDSSDDDSDDDSVEKKASAISKGKRNSPKLSNEKKPSKVHDGKEISPAEFFSGGSKIKTTTMSSSPQKKPKIPSTVKETAQAGDDGFMSDSTDDFNIDDPTKKKATSIAPSSALASSSASRNAKKRTPMYEDGSDDDEDDDDSYDDFKVDGQEEYNDDSDDSSDSDDEDFGAKSKKKKNQEKSKTPSPKKRAKRTPSPSPAKKTKNEVATPKSTKKPPVSRKKSPAPACKLTIEVLEPTMEKDSFDPDTEASVPECLAGLTFVFTGLSDELGRDQASDLVKILGGRVTTTVSSKTTFLIVLGEMLENDKPYTQGSKYIKATGELKDKVKVVIGVKKFFGLCKLYQDKALKDKGISQPPTQQGSASSLYNMTFETPSSTLASSSPCDQSSRTPSNKQVASVSAPTNPYAKTAVKNPYTKAQQQLPVNPYSKPTVSNPYAKSPPTNPYATSGKSANPYAKPGSSNPYSNQSSADSAGAKNSSNNQENGLWVDRHKPEHTRDILGNKQNVTKLQTWLKTWESTFVNNPKFPHGKAYSNPKGPWKAALLSGPPGIGKTTTATLVSKEDGRDVLEFNASDARSKKTLQETLGSSIDSQGLSFVAKNNRSGKALSKKKVIIMDEVDGMGAGDRSGMAELIQMIKKSKVPIICICNDRQSQKLKSLIPHCMDLRFSRPTKNILANRAIRIAQQEGLNVERNAAEAIAESCGNDVRQVLNLLQMWSQKKNIGNNDLTYKGLKDRESTINKDEILRVSLFDAARVILEGRRDLHNADGRANVSSIMKRTDAFFVDYSFTGLLVQQNYTKVLNGQFLKVKQSGDSNAEYKMLERLHLAAESISDYNLIESEIRGGDGNWSLLPTAATMAVKCGYHVGGEDGGFLPGYPEFTAWMGKNSTQGKNFRLLNELHHHMNYHVSANSQELRQTYVPVLRDRIFRLLKEEGNSAATEEAIQLMDEYGLSREDIAERLEVFALGKPEHTYDDLDSKQKTAFTKAFNAGKHMSQALVSEQGAGPKKKKSGGSEKDPLDLDAIDDDGDNDDEDEESDDEDDEKEMEKLRQKFKKKGQKTSKMTGKKTSKR